MLRIGVAASKMSKGSLFSYNFFVILISCLLSFLIFLICGITILLVVFIISLILHSLKPGEFHSGWIHMGKICLAVLAVVTGVFNIVAILKNIQINKK